MRATRRARASDRRTEGPAVPSGRPRCAARACARRWRAARRPAALHKCRRPCGRRRAACPAGCRRGLTLAEQKIVRLTLNPLTVLETERPGTGSPPPAGRLSPALAGLEVIAGRVLGRAAVHVLPDVVQVIALAQSRANG